MRNLKQMPGSLCDDNCGLTSQRLRQIQEAYAKDQEDRKLTQPEDMANELEEIADYKGIDELLVRLQTWLPDLETSEIEKFAEHINSNLLGSDEDDEDEDDEEGTIDYPDGDEDEPVGNAT